MQPGSGEEPKRLLPDSRMHPQENPRTHQELCCSLVNVGPDSGMAKRCVRNEQVIEYFP